MGIPSKSAYPPGLARVALREGAWCCDRSTRLVGLRTHPLVFSGELFAQAPVDQFPGMAVESVTDSSRYFVIRIEDGNGMHRSGCPSSSVLRLGEWLIMCVGPQGDGHLLELASWTEVMLLTSMWLCRTISSECLCETWLASLPFFLWTRQLPCQGTQATVCGVCVLAERQSLQAGHLLSTLLSASQTSYPLPKARLCHANQLPHL